MWYIVVDPYGEVLVCRSSFGGSSRRPSSSVGVNRNLVFGSYRRSTTPASRNKAAEASSLLSTVSPSIHVRFEKNLHFISQIVHHYFDTCLDDLDGALEARTSVGRSAPDK